MSEKVSESFNRLIWHDSKLRSLRILRNDDDLDEVLLDVELRGMPGQELTPMTVVLEDAVFFFSDIDLGNGSVQTTFQAPSARPRRT